jgi:hypothetical protein
MKMKKMGAALVGLAFWGMITSVSEITFFDRLKF